MPKAQRNQFIRLTSTIGTLDELEPLLRDQGFVAVRTAAGVMDLSTFNPYGLRRGDVDMHGVLQCQHIYRCRVAWYDSRPYLADVVPVQAGQALGELGPTGLYPLLTREEIGK